MIEQNQAPNSNILQPNMYIENADMRQSTWNSSCSEGSVTTNSDLSKCQYLEVDMKQSFFAGVSLEGSYMKYCSLKNVIIECTDLEGLFINGHNISSILNGIEGEK